MLIHADGIGLGRGVGFNRCRLRQSGLLPGLLPPPTCHHSPLPLFCPPCPPSSGLTWAGWHPCDHLHAWESSGLLALAICGFAKRLTMLYDNMRQWNTHSADAGKWAVIFDIQVTKYTSGHYFFERAKLLETIERRMDSVMAVIPKLCAMEELLQEINKERMKCFSEPQAWNTKEALSPPTVTDSCTVHAFFQSPFTAGS